MHHSIISLLVLAFCSFAEPARAADPLRPQDKAHSELEAKVDAYLAPYVANRDFSGVVLIARGDDVLMNKGYGMANYELGVRNTPDTKFRIASLTKTFTGAAIAMLKERGMLSFNDKLSKFVPDYPKGDKISVRQLLTHTAGIPNPDYGATFYTHLATGELVKSLAQKPLDFEPGTNEKYSNGGFLLLAYIVQKVSGQSYDGFLRSNIFKPLSMNDTGNFDPEPIVSNRSSGYLPAPGPDRIENAPIHDLSSSVGSGSLYSTANDLFRWARAVRSERLYKRRALPYPFGWGKRKHLGHDCLEQAGITPGFRSKFLVYLDEPVTVICLANIESGLFSRWDKDLPPIIFEGSSRVPSAFPDAIAADSHRLSECVGDYRSSSGLNLHVAERGGHLFSTFNDWPVRTYLMPTSENELFTRADYARIKLSRNPQKRVDEMAWSFDAGGDPLKFVRVERPSTK
jgi:CubicO group peptidase (beta-lactamase class C family)